MRTVYARFAIHDQPGAIDALKEQLAQIQTRTVAFDCLVDECNRPLVEPAAAPSAAPEER